MNSITQRPAFDVALVTTVEVLKALKAGGADSTAVLATLKSKMCDEAFLDRKDRQVFLKEINEALGTGYSMNQVRKADPTLLVAVTTASADVKGPLIEVDELHGEATVKLQPPAPEDIVRTEEHKLVDHAGNQEWVLPNGQQQNPTLEPTPTPSVVEQEPVVTAAATEQTSNTSLEQHTMTNSAIAQQAAPAATTSSTAANTETVAMNTAPSKTPLEIFVADLSVLGYPTDEQRQELYNVFMAQHLQFQPQAKASAQAAPEGLSNDAQFHAFVSTVPEANTAFQTFAANFKPARQSAEARSRFSMRGERDDGVRAGWVAAGSALLGAALETGHRGSLTVGSGIGAVAGIVGSFFAAEMLEDVIENQFGRYTAAGTLGLAAGSLGSGLGRMAQTAVMGRLDQGVESAPTLAAPAPAGKTMDAPSLISALLG